MVFDRQGAGAVKACMWIGRILTIDLSLSLYHLKNPAQGAWDVRLRAHLRERISSPGGLICQEGVP